MKWDNLTTAEIIQRIDILIFCILFIYEISRFIKDKIILLLAGKNIFNKTNNSIVFTNYIKLFIVTVIILGLHTIVSNIVNDTVLLISKTSVVGFLLIYINKIFYKNLNGFYENGIVQRKFVAWDNIFSYYYFQNNTVTFFISYKKYINDITMEIETENVEILNKYLLKKSIDYGNVFEL